MRTIFNSVEYNNEDRDEKLEDLKQLIFMLESNPELPIPDLFFYHNVTISEYGKNDDTGQWETVYDQDAMIEQYGRLQKTLVRYDPTATQHVPEDDSDPYTEVRMNNGKAVYKVKLYRESVCERIVVGEKIIPATPERVVPVYEYKCSPRLAKKVVSFK